MIVQWVRRHHVVFGYPTSRSIDSATIPWIIYFFPSRWISSVVKRVQYSLKVGKVMDSQNMEEMIKTFENLKNRIDRLENNARYGVQNLRREIQEEVEKTHIHVLQALRSREFASRLMAWDERDCPRRDEWKRLAKESSERIGERITLELNVWERNNHVISNLKSNIVHRFKNEFQLMEDQIREIEGEYVIVSRPGISIM